MRTARTKGGSKTNTRERFVSFIAAVGAGFFALLGLEMMTGQLIAPKPWWLGFKETPSCMLCSDKIDSAVRLAYAKRIDTTEKRLDQPSAEALEEMVNGRKGNKRLEGSPSGKTYDDLPFVERLRFRFGVILDTEDADALWDVFLGAAGTIFWSGLSLFLFWCASQGPMDWEQ